MEITLDWGLRGAPSTDHRGGRCQFIELKVYQWEDNLGEVRAFNREWCPLGKRLDGPVREGREE